MVDILVK